jgi:hypothetical protein
VTAQALPSASSAHQDAEDWRPFGDASFAGKVRELSNEFTAPPIICAFPRKNHWVRPSRAKERILVQIDESWARIFDRHLQAMFARGQQPFFDFNHAAGVVGHPREYFWSERTGVMCLVDWLPAGEKLILSRECTSFSPSWIHDSQKMFGIPTGLELNCGALLHRSTPPAFEWMPPIAPVRKSAAMKAKADFYLRKVDVLATGKKAQGDPLSAVHAADEVAARYPDLAAAYQLKMAIHREVEKDIELLE